MLSSMQSGGVCLLVPGLAVAVPVTTPLGVMGLLGIAVDGRLRLALRCRSSIRKTNERISLDPHRQFGRSHGGGATPTGLMVRKVAVALKGSSSQGAFGAFGGR